MAAHVLAIRTNTLIVLAVLRPPSAGADGVGSLLVESDPAGPSVYLNGRLVSTTFSGLMPGDGDTNRVIGAVSDAGLGGIAVIQSIRQ